jgi:hypothetical protein
MGLWTLVAGTAIRFAEVMDTYTVNLDFDVLAPPKCPGCDAPAANALDDEPGFTFHCARCGEVWSIDLGSVRRTHPRHGEVGEAYRVPRQQGDLPAVAAIGSVAPIVRPAGSCGSD